MTGNEIKMPVKVTPFDHQRRALQFVLWLFGMTDGRVRSTGAALLMQMGTGKSLVGIAICGYLSLMKKIRRVLVVCPLSICGVWQEEFAKFANFPVQLVILNGTAAKKRQQIESLQDDGTLQVIVVNYESSWRLLPELQKYDADVIIADEGHKLKEGRTSQSKGIPDIIACIEGHFFGFEVKTDKGKPTVLQEATIRKILRCGGTAAVVRSVDEVRALIEGTLQRDKDTP